MKHTGIRLGVVLIVGAACAVQAATRIWQGSVDAAWANSANWEGGVRPGPDDVAELSAAAGAVVLSENVTVGEVHYAPVPGEVTNVLTVLSDTEAPASRKVILTTAGMRRVRVGAGAELWMEADIAPDGEMTKEGYGTLVVRRELKTVGRCYVEQGRLVNEGAIDATDTHLHVGTVEPDTGGPAEFVMRDGATYASYNSGLHADLLWGGNRLLEAGTGSRAVVTHEGGLLDMTTALTQGIFLNGYAIGGHAEYNLSGGEVNLSNKTMYVSFRGTGVVNQSAGVLRAATMNLSADARGLGTYHLTGGELWLGGGVSRGGGVGSALNLGGGAILRPFNAGYTINADTTPRLTDGLVRFCSEGSGFTNTIGSLAGPGGLVKEGADTLVLAGASFAGPLLVSNGTVTATGTLNGLNAVTVAGGLLDLAPGVFAKLSALMVTGGVFRLNTNSAVVVTGNDPWARVAGEGTLELNDGARLVCLDVSEQGTVALTGGTATVFRARIGGLELDAGLYRAADLEALAGAGALSVELQRPGRLLADGFSRDDAAPTYDSLGRTESGAADWAEYMPFQRIGDIASLVDGELRLGNGSSDPALALAAASWPNGLFSTRLRFVRSGVSGATVKNTCGFLLRATPSLRTNTGTDFLGAVHVQMTAAGGLFLRENYDNNKYIKNPFTGGDYLTYGTAGSLPISVNGLPFDADGDGRLGDNEPFTFQALLSGNRLQVLVNGEPVMAHNGFAAVSASPENAPGFWKNRASSGNVEAHDAYYDDFSVVTLPYVIRHVGRFDPNIAAASPRENWNLGGNTNLVPVSPVTETVGGETVDAWRVDDISTSTLAYYTTTLLDREIEGANTNGWRLTARLRVTGENDALDGSVGVQISTDSYAYSLSYGSDATGNARVRVNSEPIIHTVAGGSVYHTYELAYDPVSGTASLSCDGAQLQAGIAKGGGAYKRVLWGANQSSSTGCAHYALVQFSVLWPDPPEPPEPPPPPPPKGTVLLLL